jgi:hypothetical protein
MLQIPLAVVRDRWQYNNTKMSELKNKISDLNVILDHFAHEQQKLGEQASQSGYTLDGNNWN